MVKTRAEHRKQIAQSWNRVETSQNLFLDILSRVPVKSIQKFKTVNKYWHKSISNKYFAKQQIMQSKKNTSFIACLVRNSSMKLYSIEVGSFKLSYLNTIYPFDISFPEFTYMISSFNGLICFVVERYFHLQIWICNRCTGESILLPQGTHWFNCKPIVGVAYGSDISDYRVFRIYCGSGRKFLDESLSVVSSELGYQCEVYSSNSGSWKYIGPVPCVPRNSIIRQHSKAHVFVGGKIYWLLSVNEPGGILSVDLEGRMEVINLPKSKEKMTEATHLFSLQGCLALFVRHVSNMDIWIWKADGEKYSWVCQYSDILPFKMNDIVRNVTSVKNKIICLMKTLWCTYDVDTKIWKKKRGPHSRSMSPAVFLFNESVLPCNGGVRQMGADGSRQYLCSLI